MTKQIKAWYVYIVECRDGTYYTGITNNLDRRITEHNEGRQGAKYTRARRPVKLINHLKVTTRSEALKIEIDIKKKKRSDKINHMNNIKSQWRENESK